MMKRFSRCVVLAGLVCSAGYVVRAQAPGAAEYLVYFGTYTGHSAKGIYAYRFQPATGQLKPLGVVAVTPNPSFLAVHPSGRFLYAANEHESNTVSAFAIDTATGKLTMLNSVSSKGDGPCHVSI